MKILFIGGTGLISSGCSELCIARGHELFLLNRGQSIRPLPKGAKRITADVRDAAQTAAAMANHSFDVVVDWIAYTKDHVEQDFRLFRDRTAQYVFISSASAYQKPPSKLPIKESTPLSNPFWQYSRNKIACEEFLMDAYREANFPVTIVRPSHTYDRTSIPLRGGYTSLARMKRGRKIIIHGDGTSLWTLTHQRDFAVGFAGLLGNPATIGEAYHITSDELLSWNQIAAILAQAAGVKADIVHIPSDIIAKFDAEWGASLLGDKSHSMIFANSKIKAAVPEFMAAVPFIQGAQEMVAWYEKEPSRQVIDLLMDQQMDRLIQMFENIKFSG